MVPQDPTDEPASELLKRIKAEKENLIADGKIKRDKKKQSFFEVLTGNLMRSWQMELSKKLKYHMRYQRVGTG